MGAFPGLWGSFSATESQNGVRHELPLRRAGPWDVTKVTEGSEKGTGKPTEGPASETQLRACTWGAAGRLRTQALGPATHPARLLVGCIIQASPSASLGLSAPACEAAQVCSETAHTELPAQHLLTAPPQISPEACGDTENRGRKLQRKLQKYGLQPKNQPRKSESQDFWKAAQSPWES